MLSRVGVAWGGTGIRCDGCNTCVLEMHAVEWRRSRWWRRNVCKEEDHGKMEFITAHLCSSPVQLVLLLQYAVGILSWKNKMTNYKGKLTLGRV